MTEGEDKTISSVLVQYHLTQEQSDLVRLLISIRMKASVPQQLIDICHAAVIHIALYR